MRYLTPRMFVTVLALSGSAGATENDPGKALATGELIERLGSRRFAEREKAWQLLMVRGPSILPDLRRALKHPDEEVRGRAQKLIDAIELAAALTPKRVTLKIEKQPLSAALKELEKQTGFRLRFHGDEPPAVFSFNLHDVTFWEALERVAEDAGLGFTVNCHEQAIDFKAGPAASPHRWSAGSFQLTLKKISAYAEIDFSNAAAPNKADRDDYLMLALSVRAEPRFIILAFGEPHIQAAVDENGKQLGKADTPKDKQRFLSSRIPEDGETARLFFHRMDRNAQRVKELRGWLPVRVVVERKRVLVTDELPKAKGTPFKIGVEQFAIKDAFSIPNFFLAVTVSGRPQPPEVAARWLDRVHFEDAAKNCCTWKESHRGKQQPDGSIGLSYATPTDPKVGPPTRMLVEEWKIVEHRIPFEFKDVPLPP